METFTLETERLALIPMSLDIATLITSAREHAEFGRGFPTSGDIMIAERLLADPASEQPPFAHYVVRERATGAFIGGAGFHGAPSGRTVELGYGLARGSQGYGYATEACRTLVEMAFATGEVDQIVAATDPDNAPSHGVLRRLGFVPTATPPTYWALSRP